MHADQLIVRKPQVFEVLSEYSRGSIAHARSRTQDRTILRCMQWCISEQQYRLEKVQMTYLSPARVIAPDIFIRPNPTSQPIMSAPIADSESR